MGLERTSQASRHFQHHQVSCVEGENGDQVVFFAFSDLNGAEKILSCDTDEAFRLFTDLGRVLAYAEQRALET
ncbi:hypothetical protein [Rhodoligotrophos defluvii]|uniref:hypothetical protein n=1 Tax=Rhodoligotrophos defluvii TaxID=2561934 RepID=UPI0010C9C15C|nr:hypothetical protein [Rhodoligotrophos defluvii]